VPRDDDTIHDIFRPTFTSGEPFERQYARFIENLRLLRNSGLTAAVYTQMTDMKREENGWLSFDREVSKMDPDRLAAIHRGLYQEPPRQTVLLPPSSQQPQTWETATLPLPAGAGRQGYTVAALLQKSPDFDALTWRPAAGPFGNTDRPVPGGSWDGRTRLVLRRSFELNEVPAAASVRVYARSSGEARHTWTHARIHLNGAFVADETTRFEREESKVAEVMLPPEAIARLKLGPNTLVVEFVAGLSARSGNLEAPPSKLCVDVAVTTVARP
jgi:hypothetical protein